MKTKTPKPPDETYARLKRLGLHGIIARWGELQTQPWLCQLADIGFAFFVQIVQDILACLRHFPPPAACRRVDRQGALKKIVSHA